LRENSMDQSVEFWQSQNSEAICDSKLPHIRFNKLMSASDKEFLGIGPRDTTPTSHPVPASQPDTEILTTPNHFEHGENAYGVFPRSFRLAKTPYHISLEFAA